jgi:DNA invertase Pin-like site-specific DNA recombinase
MGRAVLTVMSAFAQLERDRLIERTKAGMAVAKSNGRKAGRREISAENGKVAKAKAYRAKGNSVAEVQKLVGASRATVYRYLKMGDGQWISTPLPLMSFTACGWTSRTGGVFD